MHHAPLQRIMKTKTMEVGGGFILTLSPKIHETAYLKFLKLFKKKKKRETVYQFILPLVKYQQIMIVIFHFQI